MKKKFNRATYIQNIIKKHRDNHAFGKGKYGKKINAKTRTPKTV